VFADTELVVMAIVNRTPDSFYDRGASFAWRDALGTVDRAVEDGAGIVDIGGVKAGYGSEVSVDEERRRVVDLVLAVRDRHPALVIRVDTWRSEIADEVLQAGADLINDTWAGRRPASRRRGPARRRHRVLAHRWPLATHRPAPCPLRRRPRGGGTRRRRAGSTSRRRRRTT